MLLAAAAIVLCLFPLALPGGLALPWIAVVLAGALFTYLSFAVPYDPDAALSFRAKGGLFEVLAEGVRYRGQLYSYADVLHLSRYARKQSINWIPVEEFVRLRVHFKGMKEPVTLQNSWGLLMTTSGLEEIYLRLAQKTFPGRMLRYLSQLQRSGHFVYGGAHFHADGKVTIGKAQLDLRTAKLSLEPFKLIINPPGMFNRKRSIDTEIDQDVLLALMEKRYGIAIKF